MMSHRRGTQKRRLGGGQREVELEAPAVGADHGVAGLRDWRGWQRPDRSREMAWLSDSAKYRTRKRGRHSFGHPASISFRDWSPPAGAGEEVPEKGAIGRSKR